MRKVGEDDDEVDRAFEVSTETLEYVERPVTVLLWPCYQFTGG